SSNSSIFIRKTFNMNQIKEFIPGQKVEHVKTGGLYQIVCLAKIEATLEDAYVYQALSNMTFWIRPKAEMLDGRFITT
ncbi:MAG: DUF1653 domain-containing protein, partial [Burkholderiaceae bacterium]